MKEKINKEAKYFFTNKTEKVKNKEELKKVSLQTYKIKDISILELNNTFFVSQSKKLKDKEIKSEKKNIFSESELVKLPENVREISKIKKNEAFINKVIDNLDEYFGLIIKKM
ncbi:hypothetical protein TUBRATIS_20800 [Tubulinosema ratisbonensis]|uniref:Uncharacterized protein n=1 Tax=Tubulinosema ratisbonensis TaxID=291195 RepID=A0A437AK12_9MICR|nr:hypothetical protein TUBRATIS_20800 [Tubulinosema ratisbonensis]